MRWRRRFQRSFRASNAAVQRDLLTLMQAVPTILAQTDAVRFRVAVADGLWAVEVVAANTAGKTTPMPAVRTFLHPEGLQP